jgi:hypothetical protein
MPASLIFDYDVYVPLNAVQLDVQIKAKYSGEAN